MGARRIAEKKVVKKATVAKPRFSVPSWFSRRLLGGLLLVSVVGGVLGLGIWQLAQPDTLPIQRVQVEGEFRHLAREEVYAAIGALASGGFFNVDVRAVKQAAEAMPWVDRASVWRVWPDTLRVEITEQVVLARWTQVGSKAGPATGLVNVRGALFYPRHEMDADLPLFTGPGGSAETVAARYQKLSAQLATTGLRVAALKLNVRRAWELRLNNDIQLLLGRSAGDGHLQRFVDAYTSRLAEKAGQMKWVDLRYTNGFAVRWKQAATQADGRTG
ncbi:MAG: FtsQ-type POTRA domain-containing protein [Gammaproteobacteria bacterium]|nr:FtsQ-type POTRA domain-containing protein [Gammaproteobacteria bacterium]